MFFRHTVVRACWVRKLVRTDVWSRDRPNVFGLIAYYH